MNDAIWEKLRRTLPYSLLAFRPARELAIGEWIEILEHAGMHIDLRVMANG